MFFCFCFVYCISLSCMLSISCSDSAEVQVCSVGLRKAQNNQALYFRNPQGCNQKRPSSSSCHSQMISGRLGGRNSSVGSAWARCPFSLGVNMGSNSIPPKTLSDESINRGLVCAHMYFIAWTQKILTFMS